MERIYYPSATRILLAYLAMPIALIILELVFWAINTANTNTALAKSRLLGAGILGFSLFIWFGWNFFRFGFRAFRAEKFALKISPSSVDVPSLWSGRKKTIAINKIDIQRTLNPKLSERIFLNKRIYCIDGTQVIIDEFLFQPKQIEEIFAALNDVVEHYATLK